MGKTQTETKHTPGPPFHTAECSPWGAPCERHLGLHHYQCAICRVDCTMGTPAGPPRTSLDKITRCRECDNALPRFTAEGKEAVIARAAPDLLSALRSIVPSLEARLTAKSKDVEGWDILNIAKAAIAKAGAA